MALATVVLLAGGALRAAELTFEERVKAQEAIQRVYYSHQLNTTLPFEEAVPREALEKQVRDYLQKSAALDLFWKTPVTQAALRSEMERISRSTRLPDRLQEIYAALDHNPMLVEECFARPSLVDRLAHNFFASDQRIHAPERARAEALRDRLVGGQLPLESDDPHRSVSEAFVEPAEATESAAGKNRDLPDGTQGGSRRSLPHDEFLRWRATLPEHVGAIGPVLDRDEAFVIQVVLSESPDRVKVATYTVPKKSWSSWWEENRSSFYIESVHAVAAKSDPLPSSPDSAAGKSGSAFSPETAPDLSTLSPDCLQAHWDNASLGNVPSPRARSTAVWTGSLMILWGGSTTIDHGGFQNTETAVYNTGWRYDPLTDAWAPTSLVNAPAARAQHTAIWTGSVMIVWGGTGSPNNAQVLNTGGRYNPATDTWTPTTMVGVPNGIYRHTAVWTGTQMIVWAGLDSFNSPTRFGGRYEPATDSWVGMTPAPPTNGFGRYDHTAVWTGSEMLVWGGFVTAPITFPLKYNPATDSWSSYSDTGSPSARFQHGAVWTGSKMIVWGGKDNSTSFTTGGVYDPATNSWSSTSTTDAPTGLNPASFWTGSRMLIWNGTLAAQYDPVAAVWTATSSLNAPTARILFSAVWTGSQMIIWGGQRTSGVFPLDTGARYTLATDSWSPTTLSVPIARQGHTAVWTGTEMIVWGGQNIGANTYPVAGGRYDPLTDSWSFTSTTNAPSGRVGHSAVWTGAEMIVWGGGAGGPATNTGGRYDPSTDSWNSTSISQAPVGRSSATAVWTGSRMLVWGGNDASVHFNSGGRYNPSNNTWSDISTTSAPSARTGHTAVWTGSEMIVWGGSLSSTYLNSGGRYNPTSDHWVSTASSAAPQPRGLHSAVWTGSEMIVWGGRGAFTVGGALLYTGGRYNPQNDAWASLSTIGAPLPRILQISVWTGTEMIIWGGVASYQLNFRTTGGRYNPSTDTWTGITTTGAPAPRQTASAVWTGTEMIVWGGTYFGDERTGGRLLLDVQSDVDEDQDGYSFCGGDCNDANPAVHPGAVETCNQIDDNCAVAVDDGFDQDGDGFTSCTGDCNDADPAIHVAVTEVCNHVDDNCDFSVDEGFQDLDGDRYAVCVDCNDFNVNIHPNAPELCNGIDDDCDTLVDDGGDALCDSNPTDCYHGTCTPSGCASAPWPAGTSCSDNNPCTQTDTCDGTTAGCIGSNPLVCTPLDTCHNAGTCSPSSGCSNPPKPMGSSCEDGNSCTMGETCNTLGVCGGGQPTDYDFDGHFPSACGGDDCDDLTGNVWAPPQEVTNLMLTTSSPANPTWNSQAVEAGWGTNYDLSSGTLNGSGGLNSASATCLLSGSMSTNYNDSRPNPAPGSGFWYLTRAKNSCGTATYGFGSNNVERTIPACP